MANNKVCSKCKQTKPLTDYYKAKYTYESDGHDYYCKYCRKGTHLRSIENNKKRCSIEECDRPHYAKEMCRMHWARFARNGTVERKNTIRTNDKDNNPIAYSNRKYMLKTKYKLSMEDFIKKSEEGCEVCEDKTIINLNVDHDHSCCNSPISCGKCVRGVVCHKCNVAIDKFQNGLMRGDYPNYDKIKRYLEEYNGSKR